MRRRLRGGALDLVCASGGGVGGRRWEEKSKSEMIRELCNCTMIKLLVQFFIPFQS